MRRSSETYRRSLDRRRKEDEARRLRDVVPRLRSLELEFHEERAGMPGHEVHYKRVIVVARAPALFEFTCSDRACDGGGHDVTEAVLSALARGETTFWGAHRCGGKAREGTCDYVLRYEGRAGFDAEPQLASP